MLDEENINLTPSTSVKQLCLKDIENNNNEWTYDIEEILEKIRKNSIILSHHHKKYYTQKHLKKCHQK